MKLSDFISELNDLYNSYGDMNIMRQDNFHGDFGLYTNEEDIDLEIDPSLKIILIK
jgi:hypothetical protein